MRESVLVCVRECVRACMPVRADLDEKGVSLLDLELFFVQCSLQVDHLSNEAGQWVIA